LAEKTQFNSTTYELTVYVRHNIALYLLSTYTYFKVSTFFSVAWQHLHNLLHYHGMTREWTHFYIWFLHVFQ